METTRGEIRRIANGSQASVPVSGFRSEVLVVNRHYAAESSSYGPGLPTPLEASHRCSVIPSSGLVVRRNIAVGGSQIQRTERVKEVGWLISYVVCGSSRPSGARDWRALVVRTDRRTAGGSRREARRSMPLSELSMKLRRVPHRCCTSIALARYHSSVLDDHYRRTCSRRCRVLVVATRNIQIDRQLL